MKVCFKCGVAKPIEAFYRHPQMADGHLNKCKACTKLDMRHDRQTKPRVREYDRQRANLPHRKELRARITKLWRMKHPDRASAQLKANRAMKKHGLTAPPLCEGCGLPRDLEKHHPDYAKPLLVLWLCKPCHALADKIRRRLEEELVTF